MEKTLNILRRQTRRTVDTAFFSDSVDRFFIGKLITGLLFIFSFIQLLRAILALTGTAAFSVTSPMEAAVAYAVACVVWFMAFRFIEARRLKSRKSASDKAGSV